MIVDINKIVVKDRIRKDYGDIRELADDIKENGLINPPVVNKNYELLAGERRLKACHMLGWKQIEVRMMDTRDSEHELNVEISENDVRKDFSKAERVDYMKRLLEVEKRKAKERMVDGGKGRQNSDTLRSDKATAEQFGVSRDTMRKEIAIADNRELLDPADFADWDEGKLSTNKTYQKLKARLRELESRKPEVVVKEVVPEDYENLKSDLRTAKRQADSWKQDYRKEQNKIAEKSKEILRLQDEIEELKRQTINEQNNNDLNGSALTFAMECRIFLQNMGGYTFVAEHLMELNERERQGYIVAAKAMRDWASILIETINKNKGEKYGIYGNDD